MKAEVYFAILIGWLICMFALFVVPYYLPDSDSNIENRNKRPTQALSHVSK